MNVSKIIRVLLLFASMVTGCLVGNLIARQGDQKTGWDQILQLPQNTRVKVLLKNAGAIQGKWLSADEGSAILMVNKTQRTITRDDMNRIYQKQKRSRVRHALLGAAIGAGSGLGVGAIVDSRSNDSWFPNIGKQALTPLGAIVGTIIGVALPTGHWQEIYSR
jgi:hypothetical protein